MAHDRARMMPLAAAVALLLSGCATAPWPFNARQIVTRAPQPPQVVAHSALPPCPQAAITQAQWLARNMARVRLGFTKLQVVSLLGDPANAETFSLTNGAVVEVLFYHTPETICRVSARGEGLLPLVFQDDRLLGYGANYYKQFIAPMVRQGVAPSGENPMPEPQGGMPSPRVEVQPGPSLRPAPVRIGRMVQEDLPPRAATPPVGNYGAPPVVQGGNGYSRDMNDVYPVNYVPRSTVGRGEPLR